MDVLTDALAINRLSVTTIDQLTAAGPWAVRLPDVPSAVFHIVAEGTCWVTVPGQAPVHLLTGDVALVPSGAGHVLASGTEVRPRAYEAVVAERGVGRTGVGGRLELPGPGPRTHLLCGGYTYQGAGMHPVLSLLPSVIRLPAQSAAEPRGLLPDLAAELRKERPGSRTAVDRLVDVLFLRILRAWVEGDGDHPSRLHPLWDPAIARALSSIHEAPHRPWSVSGLASTAGLSRAAFARRFTRLVGEPPLTYLTRWRMELAARRLRTLGQPVAVIARDVGYTSEYAFSRAFTRAWGMPPTRYRAAAGRSRDAQDGPASPPGDGRGTDR